MISSLARQFGRACLATTASSRLAAATACSSIVTPSCRQSAAPEAAAAVFPSSTLPVFSMRSFGSKRNSNKKKKKDKKQQQQSNNAGHDETSKTTDEAEGVALQHQEWVKFQQSIAVKGFETGQTVTLQTGDKKKQRDSNRRRRRSRPTAAEEAFAERQRLTSFGGGLYPPLRYSDEETERLLAEAYAAIPPRAGKRGTRNLKRQNVRWHLVRKIRKKYKKHMAAFQVRKMQERSRKVAAVKQLLQDAPAAVQRDREYQAQVFQKWAENMKQGQTIDVDEGSYDIP